MGDHAQICKRSQTFIWNNPLKNRQKHSTFRKGTALMQLVLHALSKGHVLQSSTLLSVVIHVLLQSILRLRARPAPHLELEASSAVD